MKTSLHIPQWVSRSIDLEKWGICHTHISTLEKGPENHNYWESWEKVLRKAKKVVGDTAYKLHTTEDKKVLIVTEDFDPQTRAF